MIFMEEKKLPTNRDLIEKRRTFAIISHPDAGKTTLTEKLLLYTGTIQTAGSVKGKKSDKHAVSDWMEIEKQRVECGEWRVKCFFTLRFFYWAKKSRVIFSQCTLSNRKSPTKNTLTPPNPPSLTNQLKFVSKFMEFFIDKSIYSMYNENIAQDIVLTIPHRGRIHICL